MVCFGTWEYARSARWARRRICCSTSSICSRPTRPISDCKGTTMKMLVTGAAGFIGFHTARRLLGRGDEGVGIDNMNSYYDPALKAARLDLLEQHPNFRFLKVDIADRAAI